MQALSGMIGHKASVGGFLSPPSNPRAQPWTGGGNYKAKRRTLPGLDMPRILLKEWGALGNVDTGGAWLSSACVVSTDLIGHVDFGYLSDLHKARSQIGYVFICGAVDLATTFLNRLHQTEPQLQSFLHVSDVVLKEAEEIDKKIAENNEELGILAGVLVGVKDNICTVDFATTAGSKILEDYRPPFDATAIGKVKKCGGIVIGKTNMDEFGMGSTTEGSAYQIDRKIAENNEELGLLAGVLIGVKDNICTVDFATTARSKILENYKPAFDATAIGKVKKCGGIVIGKTNMDEFGMGSTTEVSAYQDNICTVDFATTAGSKILENYKSPFDATAIGKVKKCCGIVIGKTNMDEFGMGSTTEGSAYQVTANPWDLSRVPGGSSGGSAAAVSAGQCMVSLGSDTGGSVRQPASFCGVVGLKPTYGRVSRYGLVAYASSLDVIGCFGTSVADAGILLHAISGHDKFDATSSKREVPDFASQFIARDNLDSKPLKGLRVGLIRETIEDGVDPEVTSSIRGAASHLEELGCTVTEVSLPSFSLGLPAYYILASSESSSNLSRYDGVRYGKQVVADELNSLYGESRAGGLGSEVKMRILMGTYALSAGYYDAYYKRAQQVRTLVRESFRAALDENDILISPAAPSAAYKIGEKKNDPLSMYAGDIMTVNVNLAGLPALVLPCGFVNSSSVALPVGIQMIGAAFEEEKLLKVGHIFEQTLQGCSFIPPLVSDESAC
ncbi:Glutamyl-tRNA(Gln) amidotransferase subunit A, chloroplastic/mitochondrial [Capsicum annuum]|nr:Glutamyl-tRNA(Gln) amidotransferase subunit A, chloroplastic/mitochondrial [Capsicum annuum]